MIRYFVDCAANRQMIAKYLSFHFFSILFRINWNYYFVIVSFMYHSRSKRFVLDILAIVIYSDIISNPKPALWQLEFIEYLLWCCLIVREQMMLESE